MKKLIGAAVWVLMIGLAIGSSTVHATDLKIPIDTVIVSGVTEGEVVEVAEVAAGMVLGQTCDVRSVHRGQGAPHPGNSLIVSSGQEITTLTDVERERAAVTDGTGAITLSELITVSLEMGPDEIFEGDIDIEIDCQQQPAAVAPATESATTAPTELPATGQGTTVGLLLGVLFVASGTVLITTARRPRRDQIGTTPDDPALRV